MVTHPAPNLDVETDQMAKASAVAPEGATPAREEELTTPPLPVSSFSSPDEAIAGPSAIVPHDDFRAYQKLLKRVDRTWVYRQRN